MLHLSHHQHSADASSWRRDAGILQRGSAPRLELIKAGCQLLASAHGWAGEPFLAGRVSLQIKCPSERENINFISHTACFTKLNAHQMAYVTHRTRDGVTERDPLCRRGFPTTPSKFLG